MNKYEAICDSGVTKKCGLIITQKLKIERKARYIVDGRRIVQVVKDVPRNTDSCPDCGYFLFWRKKNEQS